MRTLSQDGTGPPGDLSEAEALQWLLQRLCSTTLGKVGKKLEGGVRIGLGYQHKEWKELMGSGLSVRDEDSSPVGEKDVQAVITHISKLGYPAKHINAAVMLLAWNRVLQQNMKYAYRLFSVGSKATTSGDVSATCDELMQKIVRDGRGNDTALEFHRLRNKLSTKLKGKSRGSASESTIASALQCLAALDRKNNSGSSNTTKSTRAKPGSGRLGSAMSAQRRGGGGGGVNSPAKGNSKQRRIDDDADEFEDALSPEDGEFEGAHRTERASGSRWDLSRNISRKDDESGRDELRVGGDGNPNPFGNHSKRNQNSSSAFESLALSSVSRDLPKFSGSGGLSGGLPFSVDQMTQNLQSMMRQNPELQGVQQNQEMFDKIQREVLEQYLQKAGGIGPGASQMPPLDTSIYHGITESELLRDLLYALQGIESDSVICSDGRHFELSPRLSIAGPAQGLCAQVLELATLHRFVCDTWGGEEDEFKPTAQSAQIPGGIQGAASSIGGMTNVGNSNGNNKLMMANREQRRKRNSLVFQATMECVRKHLHGYYHWLAVLETQIQQGVDGLTLRGLVGWIREPLQRMRTLTDICETALLHTKGGPLITAISVLSKTGDTGVRGLVENVLKEASSPIWEMIQFWTTEGQLKDPYGEFFVIADPSVRIEDLWMKMYHIDPEMIPHFLTLDQAKKILLTGKSINFIRLCCQEADWMYENDDIEEEGRNSTAIKPASSALAAGRSSAAGGSGRPPSTAVVPSGSSGNQMTTSNGNNYSSGVANRRNFNSAQNTNPIADLESCASRTNRRLVKLLLNKYLLLKHCIAIKRYLLLGQGDFVEVFISLADRELRRDAKKEVFRHNIKNLIDQAVLQSNAQSHEPEFLDRLDILLSFPNSGEIGWDVFSMDYAITTPLHVVFCQEHMARIRQLSCFLWQVRRVNYCLKECWTQQNLIRHAKNAMIRQARRRGLGVSYGGYGVTYGAASTRGIPLTPATPDTSSASKKPGSTLTRLQKMWHLVDNLLRKSDSLRSISLHLMHNIQSYIMYDVLETAYQALESGFKTAKDLDEVLLEHERYLNHLLEFAFLNPSGREILLILKRMFSLVFRFERTQDSISALSFEVMQAEEDGLLAEDANSGNENGKSGGNSGNPDDLDEEGAEDDDDDDAKLLLELEEEDNLAISRFKPAGNGRSGAGGNTLDDALDGEEAKLRQLEQRLAERKRMKQERKRNAALNKEYVSEQEMRSKKLASSLQNRVENLDLQVDGLGSELNESVHELLQNLNDSQRVEYRHLLSRLNFNDYFVRQ